LSGSKSAKQFNNIMDKPKVTPKDFFLWIAAMVALYVSVFAFINLLFDYINYAFPDILNGYLDPYSSSMRFEIASIIVLFPVFLVLMRLIRNDIAANPVKKDLWVRRWVLFITVFVAGATVIGDLITLINYFLGGEVTTRFILKVVVVLLVSGGAFLHFLADIRGYWVQYPGRARTLGYAVGVLVLAAIVSGFFIMGSPNDIRMYRFDDRKVGDLTNIQYQIVTYWQQKEKLPAKLEDLADPISGMNVPVDPQTSEPYKYVVKGTMSFDLCANFNAVNQPNSLRNQYPVAKTIYPDGLVMEDSWQHGVGEVCFNRTIDPERYPPFSKTPR